jgi:hypothetical protein
VHEEWGLQMHIALQGKQDGTKKGCLPAYTFEVIAGDAKKNKATACPAMASP